MSNTAFITDIFKKLHLEYPVSLRDQKRILKAKKQMLIKILKKEKNDSPLVMLLVNLFYLIRKFFASFSLAESSRLLQVSIASGAIILIAATLFTVKIFVFDRGAQYDQGIITFTLGDATITRHGEGPITAKINDRVKKGDIIHTGDKSMITVQIGTTKVIKILSNSKIEVKSIIDSEKTALYLESGTVLSKLKKLTRNQSYEIKSKTTVASVRGTEFLFSSTPGKTVVAVSAGKVLVTKSDTSEKKMIPKGKEAVITDSFEVAPISRLNSLYLKKIALVPFVPELGKKTQGELKKIAEGYSPEEEKIDRQIEALLPMSMQKIRKKYGYINLITLYNGRVIRGMILSRGRVFTIITPSGRIAIPAVKVKSVKTQN